MALAQANSIPINATDSKIIFIDWDAPSIEGITQVTINSAVYTVFEEGGKNTRWLTVNPKAPSGRVTVTY
jgi:hypothetical protein|tara:strand:- start:1315 stop:1524 length:210 start_codon:yes stop_codon:yes gene_type:complete